MPTAARPDSQPARYAGPFDRARGVTTMRTATMTGGGLMAMPTANGKALADRLADRGEQNHRRR